MATALQCPNCGHKHRLDTLGEVTVFPCAKCARQLKVPAEYRPGASATNETNGGGAAARSAAPVAPGARPAGARPTARPARSSGPSMKLPVRILAWVIAFVLGALVVRTIAKITGFVGGDTFVDLLIDHSMWTYLRLALLVPVWALFATLFATLFIEGPSWWAQRRAGTAGAAGAAAGASAAGSAAAAPAAAPKRAGTGAIPRRVPAAAPVPSASEPRTAVVPTAAAAAAVSAPAEESAEDYAARVAAGQRPRRIPRRDAGS